MFVELVFPNEFQVRKLRQREEYLLSEHIQILECDFGRCNVDAPDHYNLHLVRHFGEGFLQLSLHLQVRVRTPHFLHQLHVYIVHLDHRRALVTCSFKHLLHYLHDFFLLSTACVVLLNLVILR